MIANLRDLLTVDHVVYHSSKIGNNPSVQPYIQLTYPAVWVKRYLQMGYVDIDPVLREGFLRTLPFDWSEMQIRSEAEGGMLLDALSHGVGPLGLSVPVRDKQGHRGLFSLSKAGTVDDWVRLRDASLQGIVEIAYRVHNRVLSDQFGETKVRLSMRELDVSIGQLRGKRRKTSQQLLEYRITRSEITSNRLITSSMHSHRHKPPIKR